MRMPRSRVIGRQSCETQECVCLILHVESPIVCLFSIKMRIEMVAICFFTLISVGAPNITNVILYERDL